MSDRCPNCSALASEFGRPFSNDCPNPWHGQMQDPDKPRPSDNAKRYDGRLR